jgi:hypothetical protein
MAWAGSGRRGGDRVIPDPFQPSIDVSVTSGKPVCLRVGRTRLEPPPGHPERLRRVALAGLTPEATSTSAEATNPVSLVSKDLSISPTSAEAAA